MLAASPCHGSEKLLLNGVSLRTREGSETRLRDTEWQQKRMTAVLASKDPLLPHNNYCDDNMFFTLRVEGKIDV